MENKNIIIINFYKVDKGKRGVTECGWKQFLNVNIINFARVDMGGGKMIIHKKWITCRLFLTLPLVVTAEGKLWSGNLGEMGRRRDIESDWPHSEQAVFLV